MVHTPIRCRTRWLGGLVLAFAGLGLLLEPAAGQDTAGRNPVQPRPAPSPESDQPRTEEVEKAAAERAEATRDEDQPELTETDIRLGTFPVAELDLEYRFEHPQHPDPADILADATMWVRWQRGGWIPARRGTGRAVKLNRLASLEVPAFYASTIRAIGDAVVRAHNEQGIVGVFVTPAPQQIGSRGADLREFGNATLKFIVTTSQVGDVRTMALGERLPEGPERLNHPAHRWIREHSPVQSRPPRPQATAAPAIIPSADLEEGPKPQESPADGEPSADEAADEQAGGGEGTDETPEDPATEGRGSLLYGSEVERYAEFLSRFPGRDVDVAVAPGEQDGEVVLDYLVNENRPLFAYFQVSNTGTESTSEWRQRIGASYTQLFGIDDLLEFDYVTSTFETHAVSMAVGVPLSPDRRLRGRLQGMFSTYDASTVGIETLDFEGTTYGVTAELTWNFLQAGNLFVDLNTSVGYQNNEVETDFVGTRTEGESGFILPAVGVSLEKLSAVSRLRGHLGYEGVFALADEDDLAGLGRTGIDDTASLLRYSGSFGVFLEPLLFRDAWSDPDTPESSTLAHELAFDVKGQWVFASDRLAPQYQHTAGGLFTVRGYDESLVAGDTAIVGSAEYRFHVPRIFDPGPKGELFGEPFAYRRTDAFAQPDWDLILRAFFDAAYVEPNEAQANEEEETLLGTGLGVEMRYKQTASLRLDWGVALKDAGTGTRANDSGDNRIHVLFTLRY